MRLINRLFLALLSCALSVGVFAQTQDSTVVAAKDSVAPKKTKVFLEHANTLSFDKERNAEAQVGSTAASAAVNSTISGNKTCWDTPCC